MGTLFNCSWEAGPPRGMATGSAYRQMFIAQDVYDGVAGSDTDSIRDAENGDTVPGNGRYGYHPSAASLSAPGSCISSSAATRSGDNIWWFLRFIYDGFGTTPTAGEYYWMATMGVQDPTTGAGDPDHLAIALEAVTNDTATNASFELRRQNSDFSVDATLIDSSTEFSVGDEIVIVVGYDDSTGDIEMWINDVSEGTANNSLATSSSQGYIIPFNETIAGKEDDDGLQLVWGHLFSNDDDATTGLPTTRPTTSLQAINYFPNANGSNTAWHGDYTDIDDESGTSADANVVEPTSANDKETFTFEDANGTSHDVLAAQVIYLYQKKSDGAGSNHEVYASIGGSDWQTETPYEGAQYVGDITGTATTKAWHWTAHLFQQTPEGTPADWSITDFDALEAGLNAIETTNGQREVHEYNVIAVGNNLERPGVTPPAAGDARSFAVVIG